MRRQPFLMLGIWKQTWNVLNGYSMVVGQQATTLQQPIRPIPEQEESAMPVLHPVMATGYSPAVSKFLPERMTSGSSIVLT